MGNPYSKAVGKKLHKWKICSTQAHARLTIIPRQLLPRCHVARCKEGHPVVIVVRALDFDGDIQHGGVLAPVVDEPGKDGSELGVRD